MSYPHARIAWWIGVAGLLVIVSEIAAQSSLETGAYGPAASPYQPHSQPPVQAFFTPYPSSPVRIQDSAANPYAVNDRAVDSQTAPASRGIFARLWGSSRPASSLPVVQKSSVAPSSQRRTRHANGELEITLQDYTRLAETTVKLNWLADPLTFPCSIQARATNVVLELSGTVPDQETKSHAVWLASQNGTLAVIDALRVRAGSVLRPQASPIDTLNDAVASALRGHVTTLVSDLQFRCAEDGRVSLWGVAPSHEDKLAVSFFLRRVIGCTSVENHLSVRTVADGGKLYAFVSSDGSYLVPIDNIGARDESPEIRQANAPVPAPASWPASTNSPQPDSGLATASSTMYQEAPRRGPLLSRWLGGDRQTATIKTTLVPVASNPPNDAVSSEAAARLSESSAAQYQMVPVDEVRWTKAPANSQPEARSVTLTAMPEMITQQPLLAQAARPVSPSAPIANQAPRGYYTTKSTSWEGPKGPEMPISDKFTLRLARNRKLAVVNNSLADQLASPPPKPRMTLDLAKDTLNPYGAISSGGTAMRPSSPYATSPTLQRGSVARTYAPTMPAHAFDQPAPLPSPAYLPGVLPQPTGISRSYNPMPVLQLVSATAPPADFPQAAAASNIALAPAAEPNGSACAAGKTGVEHAYLEEKAAQPGDGQVTSGVIVLMNANDDSKEASATAQAYLLNCLKQSIEDSCGPEVEGVTVEFLTDSSLLVNLKVHDSAAAGRVSRTITHLPELGPYQVRLKVQVAQ